MSPKKTPRGTPKISYRDLLAGKEAPDVAKPGTPAQPEATGEVARAETAKSKSEPQSGAEGAEETQKNSRKGTVPQRESIAQETSEQISGTLKPALGEESLRVSSAASAPSAVKKPEAAEVPTPLGTKELPPARRRDRSRELTPRELAAVLNEEQAAAAREKAEKAALEAEAEQAAEANAGQAGMPPAAINAAIIEDEGQRHSTGISTDTMEFAVAAATATLPFRDRVRARAGLVEVLRFRIGTELFATDLSAAEEVLERPAVHRVPEMPDQMLGVFSLRGKLIPVFSPTRVLGASLAGEFGAAIVVRGADRRIALAIDDVDDVMTLDLAKLREIPSNSDPEGTLLAVAWHGSELVSLIDAEALLAACQSEQLAETV